MDADIEKAGRGGGMRPETVIVAVALAIAAAICAICVYVIYAAM